MPHTPKTTKRNLFNSSPSQIDKNTKVLITPNRYAVLNTDEDNILTTPTTSTTEDPDRPPHKVYNAKPVAPSIHIKNISNFSAFNTVLKNITGPNGFTFVAHKANPEEIRNFETANRYHFYHTFVLFGVPFCRFPKITGALFITGTLIFCGTCYYNGLTGDKTYNKYTPTGGMLLIAAWMSMVL